VYSFAFLRRDEKYLGSVSPGLEEHSLPGAIKVLVPSLVQLHSFPVQFFFHKKCFPSHQFNGAGDAFRSLAKHGLEWPE
jgi:hypothetical protein